MVSVIVPVFNGADVLPRLLNALTTQTYPQQWTEILIVDNNSTDNTANVVSEWASKGVRYVNCAKQGSYAARNLGIAHSAGDILAFTDADCIPEPNWLQAAVNELGCQAVDRVIGAIEVPLRTPVRVWEVVDFTNYILGEDLARDGLAATANLVLQRTVFGAVGLFDDSIISGGDMEFSRRCNSAGISYYFSKDVVVKHPPRTVMETIRRSRRIGVGLAQITGDSLVARSRRNWRVMLFGAAWSQESRDRFNALPLTNWHRLQVRLLRYFAVDIVRNVSHVWGRWILRQMRAEEILANLSCSESRSGHPAAGPIDR
jgi:glycosyltransferase involved in cell wall biosynthesis